jgi:zinc transport system substrate-binding protein
MVLVVNVGRDLMRKIISVLIILGSVLILGSCNNTIDNGKLNIVTTIFPIYDIVRSISDDTVNIDLMISPGQDIHSYDPSTDDIINVKKSDLFIYIGDNMETWVDDLTKNESDMFVLEIAHDERIKLSSLEHHEHHDHDHNVDMHIWTNPYYVLIMVELITNALIEVNPSYKELYEKNALEYTEEVNKIIQDINEIVDNKKRDTLYFGAPFAFYYFTTAFGLEHRTVYDTCSIEVEPTIDKILTINKEIIDNDIPVVYTKELLNDNIARKLIEGSNAKLIVLHSGHNVSSSDFEKGITFLEIWHNNIEALKEGLL